ncbi:MAG: ferritin-like domain-containing protein [Planctomycetota bacterium]
MADTKLIDKLNDILKHEWTGVAQYAHYSFVLPGTVREVYAPKFYESAEESFEHAKRVAEKISAMGGVPSVERNAVQLTTDFGEMLEHSLAFEQKAVEEYTAALALSDGVDRALTVLLEDLLIQEQDGVDELTLILREHAPAAIESAGDVKKLG